MAATRRLQKVRSERVEYPLVVTSRYYTLNDAIIVTSSPVGVRHVVSPCPGAQGHPVE